MCSSGGLDLATLLLGAASTGASIAQANTSAQVAATPAAPSLPPPQQSSPVLSAEARAAALRRHEELRQTTRLGLIGQTGAGLAGTTGSYLKAQADQRVAEANAKLAGLQAKDAIMRGAKAETDLRRRAAKFKGAQVYRLAAGNVQLQGSALDILEETDDMIEADAAVIRENAQGEARARRVESFGHRARAYGSDPFVAGSSTLLTSAGQVAPRWYAYADRYREDAAAFPPVPGAGWSSYRGG